ncbi:hypothetical protein CARUB_v10021853mg [Capsella rubella]|uniref:F-box domain-containing protein n=1 Tax=Capsella rubella TaxID=81985 RepID=R0ICF6_9BRAS|nr:putative F-box protein At4g21240 [Capsella rubella]EOA34333.1 hypothetical protein CARUB_v10021853mg [Capsella rubella]
MIPTDMIHEILLRLPAKSAGRFRCVSKLWSSIITRPDFIRSFGSPSSTRLCLLICARTLNKCRIFNSIPQHEHPDRTYNPHVEKYEIYAPRVYHYHGSETVHGLTYLADPYGNIIVWNPTIRQHVKLPRPSERLFVCNFLGYDPVEDKYKVLCISICRYQDPLVFTLGPQESWRVAQNNLTHSPSRTFGARGICINGHVYYEAEIQYRVGDTFKTEDNLMSFDVRYEKFNVIIKPANDKLCDCFFNYSGKVAWLCSDVSCIRFWVLEDKEKQEWSPRKFPLPFPRLRDPIWLVVLRLRGITHDTCEFIYTCTTLEAIYVLYYDPKRNRIRRVKYEGLQEEEEDFLKNNIEENIHYYPNHCESLVSLKDVPGFEPDWLRI